jgi:acyl-coenzyme A thioesterase PaaI-like protein
MKKGDYMEQKEKVREDYCFACGKANPVGLHLEFCIENGKFITEKILPREYQSYTGVVHGGIVTTMLDEAMGGYLYELGEKAVTARIEVRYRKPTPVGEKLTITGWVASRRRNFVEMQATIALADGTITAEGTAKMAVVD